jgi:hypothetical protein
MLTLAQRPRPEAPYDTRTTRCHRRWRPGLSGESTSLGYRGVSERVRRQHRTACLHGGWRIPAAWAARVPKGPVAPNLNHNQLRAIACPKWNTSLAHGLLDRGLSGVDPVFGGRGGPRRPEMVHAAWPKGRRPHHGRQVVSSRGGCERTLMRAHQREDHGSGGACTCDEDGPTRNEMASSGRAPQLERRFPVLGAGVHGDGLKSGRPRPGPGFGPAPPGTPGWRGPGPRRRLA